MQHDYEKAKTEESIPHFVALSPDDDTMFCYKVHTTEDMAYDLLSNENVEMAGYFMYYSASGHVALDMVSLSLNKKRIELPNHMVFSGSKREVRIGDVVVPVQDPQRITIMETQIIIIPSKMDHHSEVTVNLEWLSLEFSILFTNNSQLQLVIVNVPNSAHNKGLIGKCWD